MASAQHPPHHEPYIDPWQEYRGISAKLRKRFLRKPNVSEATREFAVLAQRLREDDCQNYSALCQLAIARCEHSAGNVPGETGALKEAARFFVRAEQERRSSGLPGFEQNLTSAIHCYGHAIKTHVEQRHIPLAASLSLELGIHLYRLERAHEAIEHFDRAARYFDSDANNRMQALRWLAAAQADAAAYTETLQTLDELWTLATKAGNAQELGRDCEIATVLVLLHLQALPRQMNERQTRLMHMYTWVAEPGEPLPPQGSCVKDEELFLLLQSFVMAVQWDEAASADRCLTDMLTSLRNPLLMSLGLDIVEKLYRCDYHKNH